MQKQSYKFWSINVKYRIFKGRKSHILHKIMCIDFIKLESNDHRKLGEKVTNKEHD